MSDAFGECGLSGAMIVARAGAAIARVRRAASGAARRSDRRRAARDGLAAEGSKARPF
jgi:hypothetical protein